MSASPETLIETRHCGICRRDMTVTINDYDGYKPLWADIDKNFVTLGWDGNLCPQHAKKGNRR